MRASNIIIFSIFTLINIYAYYLQKRMSSLTKATIVVISY